MFLSTQVHEKERSQKEEAATIERRAKVSESSGRPVKTQRMELSRTYGEKLTDCVRSEKEGAEVWHGEAGQPQRDVAFCGVCLTLLYGMGNPRL